jgi:DNA helicase II / ATP-dependent DNA helicase PcrA
MEKRQAYGSMDEHAQEVRVTLQRLLEDQEDPTRAVSVAVQLLSPTLQANYKKDWDQRKVDFPLVEKLARNHTSIGSLIEHYLLDPINASEIRRGSNGDVVVLITVHSAKGTQAKVYYVMNVSPGAYPSFKAMGSPETIEVATPLCSSSSIGQHATFVELPQ